MDKTLLIIDDDTELCEGLAEVFSAEGYSVNTAGDALQGLALLNKKNYNIILLDIKLPGMSGIEVLKQLKGNPPKARIFIISGAPDAQQRLDAEGASSMVSGIIRKPFDIETMLKTLKLPAQ